MSRATTRNTTLRARVPWRDWREVLAHPGSCHGRCRVGLGTGLPQADRHARAIARVGEAVADEAGLGLEGVEHAALGLFGELWEGALDDLVVRDTQCLHERVLLR